MVRFYHGMRGVVAALAFLIVVPAGAQENLDLGKTAPQLFASDCAICHKSPQSLGKAGGLFGLESFLRQHYTASRESAAAISKYLQSVADAPPPVKRSRRSVRRPSGPDKSANKKPDEGKSDDAKSKSKDSSASKSSASKSDDAKSDDAKPADAQPAGAQSMEAKPAEAKAEPKSEPKTEPKAKVEAKPAGPDKPE